VETVETINQRLIDHFGRYLDGTPMFRVVWSSDQVEKRRTNLTPEGWELPYEIVREVKKYSYAQDRWILEKLTEVDDFQGQELVTKLSHEPAWVFETKKGDYLPLNWLAVDFVVKRILKMLDPDDFVETEKETPEARRRKAAETYAALWGNESETTDAMRYKEGIVVPGNFERNN
jgi:hypothetical protein